MRYMKGFLYWLIQCTWGIVQTLLGFVLFLSMAGCKHEIYHGAVLTYHKGDWGGVSLGAFIFVSGNRGENWTRDARVHEFGHTVQSLILGPLYMLVIGVPSMIWCNGKKFNEKRDSGEATYYDFYPEYWANDLGAKVTGEPLPKWENIVFERQKRLARMASCDVSDKTIE